MTLGVNDVDEKVLGVVGRWYAAAQSLNASFGWVEEEQDSCESNGLVCRVFERRMVQTQLSNALCNVMERKSERAQTCSDGRSKGKKEGKVARTYSELLTEISSFGNIHISSCPLLPAARASKHVPE